MPFVDGSLAEWQRKQAFTPWVTAAWPWEAGSPATIHPAPCPVKPSVSTRPFTCLPPTTSMLPSAFTLAGWQSAQVAADPAVNAGCPAGGSPWQVPQAAWVPSTTVQRGETLLPPGSVAPWQ